MKHILKPEDMEMAQLFNEGLSYRKMAVKFGLALRTIERRSKWPEMIEYRAKLSAAQDKAIESRMQKEAKQAVAKLPIIFRFEDAAERFLKLADHSTSELCRLQATRALMELYGVAKAPLGGQVDDLQNSTTRPDVYQAEWMRKPQ
ncbi:MAG TPA: hypothetical protein VMQ60_03195 [Acidobacteriaceae bacterium]|jgi:IS30 family transposase|nr:hypothetical protein [Acidobacteriaceae bacterium]